MIMEWLGKVPWDHPGIVGPVAAALTAGVFAIVIAIIKRKKPSEGGAASVTTSVNPEITVTPQIEIENKPSNVLESTVNLGLDEKAVGKELSKAVDPLRQEIKALSEQLATAQFAPKQLVPVSGDPLKVKAVEFYNTGVDACQKGEIGQALGHWLDALKLDPDFAYAHNNLGAVLAGGGELDMAIEHYNTALRSEPDLAVAHFNLGCVLAQKEEAAAAVAALAKAIELDPTLRDVAKIDQDYDPIRDDPAFRKLVYGE